MSAAISLARGAPCPEALDDRLIARCADRALAADGTRILSYGDGQGYPPLRELLAEQHGVSPASVFVSNGSLQAFVLMLQTGLSAGDRIAVEAPTYDRALLQLRAAGMDVQPIPVDDDGLDVDALAAECAAGRAPRMLYTIPNFQNPSGVTLSEGRRRRLVELAGAHGFVILEDDPYGRLRFEGDDIPGLHTMAGSDTIWFTSSFSKTVAPGLRVGYVIAPEPVVAELAGAANRLYISPSLLAQAAINELVRGGELDGNIARVTALMRARRDAMVEGLAEMPDGTRCTPPQGGFFCWLELPEGLDADALHRPAAEAGVVYVRGSDCFLDGGRRTLRLAYSGVGPDEIREAMRRLGGVFRQAAGIA